jgi:hypothetical protein
MASEYQLVTTLPGTLEVVLRVADRAFIPFDPANRDYADFCAWQAEGNQADPAPTSAQPTQQTQA